VAENIAYGRPDASDEQIRHAATIAGADPFIQKLPEKYDTQISESGQNLSGGQRQRIAIARALLTEAPIMVLDEPTSALDPQHEQLITETLRSLKRQRTIILVSHRLSTVADCDQIYVMDNGRIVERGTHDQLVAMRGIYFRMARHQMKLEADVVPV
jgi:subfamily B ATP-binding cassette protein MsbA